MAKFTGKPTYPGAGLSSKQRSQVAKKARAGADIGKKGKKFSEVAAKAAKQYGSAEAGKRVAAAAMWKNQAAAKRGLSRRARG